MSMFVHPDLEGKRGLSDILFGTTVAFNAIDNITGSAVHSGCDTRFLPGGCSYKHRHSSHLTASPTVPLTTW